MGKDKENENGIPEFKGLKKGWFILDRGLWDVVKKMYPDNKKEERMLYHYVLIMMYNDAWYGDEPYQITHKVWNSAEVYGLEKGEFEFKRDYWSELTGLTKQNLRTFEKKLIKLGLICVVKNGKGQSPIYRLCQQYSNNIGNNIDNNIGNNIMCRTDAGLRGVTNNIGNNIGNNIDNNTPTNIPVNKEVNKDYSNKNSTVNKYASSLRSDASAEVAENFVQEKDKGQVPSGQSGLYQPQPTQAPDGHKFQMDFTGDNAFGIAEVYDRLKFYFPEGYKFDKNTKDFIDKKYWAIQNPNRKGGAFSKSSGGWWSLFDFADWIAKLLREQGHTPYDKPMIHSQSGNVSQRIQEITKCSTNGSSCTPQDLKKLGVNIIGL